MHLPRTGGNGHGDRIIAYRTWGGACWQAEWDPRADAFDHRPATGGAGHLDDILNYTYWTFRAGNGDWYMLRR